MPFTNQMGRKVGSAWNILAPAKLNLYLEVLGRRTDGFHALETLMMPVRIYDQLTYQHIEASPLALRVQTQAHGSEEQQLLGRDEDNLIIRAARLLAQDAGITPYGRFDLVKRIPMQAGMGGGSSDAAAALLLANEAWQLNYPRRRLMELAAELGSDVPFFLAPGTAICRGRGELVEPVHGLPRLHFVIAKPPVGFSTPEVFRQVRAAAPLGAEVASSSAATLQRLLTSLRSGSLAEAGRRMTNRLEAAASRLAPWLSQLRSLFSQTGCLAQFMTGSGSAYVGVMRSARQARHAAGWLRNYSSEVELNVGQVFATSSC